MARHYLEQDVWETDIAKYGIDIWMTLNAIVQKAKLCQANLGVKIHDAKEPAESLGPMFRQVCGTFFSLLEQQTSFWMPVEGSDSIPTFGLEERIEPEPLQVNQRRMIREFREGLRLFGGAYRELFSQEVFTVLCQTGELEPEVFRFPVEIWVKLVYELAAKYHQLWVHRMKLLTLMTPLYLGRVASFITDTRDMDSQEAEEVVEKQARSFEEHKPYLVELWKQGNHTSRLEEKLGREY